MLRAGGSKSMEDAQERYNELRNQGLNCPFLYRNNTWAEIISLPESKNEIVNNYEIF